MITINDFEKAKLRTLNEDSEMIEALKKLFLNSFLKIKSNEIYVIAAARIAIDLLDQGFQELQNLKKVEQKKEINENPAL